MRSEHVLGFALEHPWAVTPSMLKVIASVVARHVAGESLSSTEMEAALVNRKNLPQPKAGSIAVIPVYGVIAPRMNMLSEISGGTTYEKLTGQLREAMASKAISTIVLDIDSPGGSVAGATEFARELMKARTKKPIIAQVQYTCASAAYWAAACCTEIIAAPSSMQGSVGVFSSHTDVSEAMAKLGVKKTFIAAGEGKVDGNETEPLSEQSMARIKKSVDEAYASFVGDVVKGRGAGMTTDRVRSEWKAHVYGAAEALSIGMIDGIATLDQTLVRLLSASPDANDQHAALTFQSVSEPSQEPATATEPVRVSDAELERQVFELYL